MRMPVVILVALATVLVTGTEADFVEKTLEGVVDWVKNNCQFSIPGGFSCKSWSGRRRRSVHGPFLPSEPWSPNNPNPWSPNVPNPQNPNVPNPWNPNVPNPRNPNVPNPWNPNVPNPWNPNVPSPWNPNVPNPWNPNVPNPRNPNVPNPWNPNVPKPWNPFVTWDADTKPKPNPNPNSVDPETGFPCGATTFPFTKVPRTALDTVFRKVDSDNDDQMDVEEMNQYQTTMKIVENCVEKQNENATK